MNKKGTQIFYILMMGVLFFFLGLALAQPVSQTIDESMNSSELNCSNTTISQQDKAVCTSLDSTKFLFIGTIFGLAGLILAGIAIR